MDALPSGGLHQAGKNAMSLEAFFGSASERYFANVLLGDVHAEIAKQFLHERPLP